MSMRHRPTIPLLSLLAVAIVMTVSCTSTNSPKSLPAGIDSLLAAEIYLEEAGLGLRLPTVYAAASDSILSLIQESFAQNTTGREGLKLTDFYMDTINTESGILVTRIDEMNLSADTARFFNGYREILYGLYGEEYVQEKNFTADSIFVKYFQVSDGQIARLQALCLSPDGPASEIIFFAPESVMGQNANIIEASLATIVRK